MIWKLHVKTKQDNNNFTDRSKLTNHNCWLPLFFSPQYGNKIDQPVSLSQTLTWLTDNLLLDSEDEFFSGCQNVNHLHRQPRVSMRVHESWHYEKFAVCVRLSQGRFLLSISNMTQCFRTMLSNEVCGYKIIMKIVLKIGKFYCPELKEANLHQKLWKERKITGVYLEK